MIRSAASMLPLKRATCNEISIHQTNFEALRLVYLNLCKSALKNEGE